MTGSLCDSPFRNAKLREAIQVPALALGETLLLLR